MMENAPGAAMLSRQYAILTEGRFEDRNAKTAHGLIAYGREDAEVVAIIDSALAGRRVLDVMPNLRREPLVEAADDLEPILRRLP